MMVFDCVHFVNRYYNTFEISNYAFIVKTNKINLNAVENSIQSIMVEDTERFNFKGNNESLHL